MSYAAIPPPGDAPLLEFHDAAAIVAAALRRLRAKAAYSAVPLFLLPASFTVTEARNA